MVRTLCGLVVVGALAGCGHTLEYTALNPPPRPLFQRTPDSVEVFMTSRPTRPATEIGFFVIEQMSPASGGSSEMIAQLRTRAGKMGCDAIAVSAPSDRVQSYSTSSSGTVMMPNAGTMGTYSGSGYAHPNMVRSHTASCLVYTDAPAVTSAEVKL